MAKAYQERLIALIKDTVTLLCKNGLEYNQEFCVEGLLGVTLDKDEVFLIPIRELVNDKGVGTTDTTDDIQLDTSQADGDVSGAPMSPKRERKKKRRHAEPTAPPDDAGYDNGADGGEAKAGRTSEQENDADGGEQPTSKRRQRDEVKTELSKVKAEDIVVIKEEVDDEEFVSAFQDSSMDSGSLNRTEQGESGMAYYSQPGTSQGPAAGMGFSMDQLAEGSALSANMTGMPHGSEGDISWLQQSPGNMQNPPGDWQGQKHQGDISCDLCGARFCRATVMKRHKLSVHMHVRFVCQICGQYYTRKHKLLTHLTEKHQARAGTEPWSVTDIYSNKELANN